MITHDYPNDYEAFNEHFNLFILKAHELLEQWNTLYAKIINSPLNFLND